MYKFKFFLHRANKLGCYDNYSTLIPSIKQDIIIFWCKIVKNSINYSLKSKPESNHLNNYRNKTEENNQEKHWSSTLTSAGLHCLCLANMEKSDNATGEVTVYCIISGLNAFLFTYSLYDTTLWLLYRCLLIFVLSVEWLYLLKQLKRFSCVRPMFLSVYSIRMGQYFYLSDVYFVFFSHLKQMSLIFLPSNTHMLPTACCTACNKPF